MNYYEELHYIDIILGEIEMFAEAILSNKNGCFNHRVENTINQLLTKSVNPTSFSNKIISRVNDLNYDSQIKNYLIFFIESLFYPNRNTKYKVPTNIQKYLKANNIQNDAMIEGFFNYSKVNEVIKSTEDMVENDIKELIVKKEIVTEKFIEIFCNNGFELFNHIIDNYVNKGRGKVADLSYYYWRMYDNNPKYIHKKPTEFKEWFLKQEKYEGFENFEKIRPFSNVNNKTRRDNYIMSLNWFERQK